MSYIIHGIWSFSLMLWIVSKLDGIAQPFFMPLIFQHSIVYCGSTEYYSVARLVLHVLPLCMFSLSALHDKTWL